MAYVYRRPFQLPERARRERMKFTFAIKTGEVLAPLSASGVDIAEFTELATVDLSGYIEGGKLHPLPDKDGTLVSVLNLTGLDVFSTQRVGSVISALSVEGSVFRPALIKSGIVTSAGVLTGSDLFTLQRDGIVSSPLSLVGQKQSGKVYAFSHPIIITRRRGNYLSRIRLIRRRVFVDIRGPNIALGTVALPCVLTGDKVYTPHGLIYTKDNSLGSIKLAWDASPTAGVSYRVYWGTQSGTYTNQQDVGTATSCTVSGLATPYTYYFAITAYNTDGESAFSNEISDFIKRGSPLTASGSKVKITPVITSKYGSMYSAFVASGIKRSTAERLGSAISAFLASGPKEYTPAPPPPGPAGIKDGSGITSFVLVGNKVVAYSETGNVVAVFGLSGGIEHINQRTGTANISCSVQGNKVYFSNVVPLRKVIHATLAFEYIEEISVVFRG